MSSYAFSDLHGNYAIWEKIKEIIKPEDTVFCLGDCADRGKDGWQIIKEVIDAPNIIYLMGNHEDMLLEAIIRGYHSDEMSLWLYNGGDATRKAINKDENAQEYIEQLSCLPIDAFYTNSNGQKIYLNHSGAFNDSEYDLIWSRKHFLVPAPPEIIIVHGHTPVQLLNNICSDFPENIDSCFKYNGKIDIDLGTAFTNKACLLNLDTFEPIIIELEAKEAAINE